MARVRIDLPVAFPFVTELAVRIGDINYGGHLGNDAVLRLIHEARLQYLISMGHSELDIGGPSLIMADVAVSYRAEAFHGDVLSVSVAPADITSRSFDLIFKLTHTSKGQDIAYAKTGMVAFDYKERKVTKLPAAFIEKLSRPQAA